MNAFEAVVQAFSAQAIVPWSWFESDSHSLCDLGEWWNLSNLDKMESPPGVAVKLKWDNAYEAESSGPSNKCKHNNSNNSQEQWGGVKLQMI